MSEENNSMEEKREDVNEHHKEKTITLKKDDLWRYSTFVLVAVVIIGALIMVSGGNSGTGSVVAPTGEVAKPSVVKASVDDDAMMGDANAPITIIEFSDYQCPFCQRHYSQTAPLLKSNYVDTGKVRIVFRDFPLDSLHPQATPAANAAECVGELGGDEAYFEYHDKLFDNQQLLSAENYKKWAQEMGYDINDCVDNQEMVSEVKKDLQDVTSAGGRGTPYFIIMTSGDSEGMPISGAYPYSAFSTAIEAQLDGKFWYADASTGQIVVE
ncbi:MAG: thioredoxin domain-containing protein [Nanoarchaeota archaeon]|nr:thioredoxin domain-containing protein [Nanoarchaeota archaeon]